MRHTDLIYLLALKRQPGIGDIYAKKLLTTYADFSEIFERSAEEIAIRTTIPKKILAGIQLKNVLDICKREADWIAQNQICVLTFLDENYPEKLRYCHDSPAILFAKGNCTSNRKKCISIVGTRNMSGHSKDFAKRLLYELSFLDPVVISGYALGVDIEAHLSAIENNMQTIAVLGHGLHRLYPKSHSKYASGMLKNGGFLTEFMFDQNPEAMHFVRRNRIVAGMSDATIVIESAEKGGSLITANLAYDYNREVFAVPGRPTDVYSAGCHQLIKSQKAHVLTSAADLIYQMNWDLFDKKPTVQMDLFPQLEPKEQEIISSLYRKSQHINELAFTLSISISEISFLLLQLELKGMIRVLQGNYLELV